MSFESKKKALNGLKSFFAADAAAMPTHWIYDYDKAVEVLGDRWETPPFFPTLSCPFYCATEFPGHYATTGDLSPYGEEATLLLNFLRTKGGDFTSGDEFASFTSDWAENYTGRKSMWTVRFEKNVAALKEKGVTSLYPACGVDDPQANVALKVVILASRYYGNDRPLFLQKVEEAVRTHQNNRLAVDVALSYGKILWKALDGSSLDEAIRAGKEDAPESIVLAIETAYEYRMKPDSKESMLDHFKELCADYGGKNTPPEYSPIPASIMLKTCGLPQALIVSLKLLLDAETDGNSDSFVHVIERNIQFGGDSCGRNAFLCGIMAAMGKDLPQSWYDRTHGREEINSVGYLLLERTTN